MFSVDGRIKVKLHYNEKVEKKYKTKYYIKCKRNL